MTEEKRKLYSAKISEFCNKNGYKLTIRAKNKNKLTPEQIDNFSKILVMGIIMAEIMALTRDE